METISITGGRPLAGCLAVQGSKNAVLPILAAVLAVPGRFLLTNVPPIRDVDVTCGLLEGLGVVITRDGTCLALDSTQARGTAPDPALAGQLRSSVLLLGALAARAGRGEIPLPGGCVLGARPLDLHLGALEALGAKIDCGPDRLLCRGRLRGGTVILPFPSVGATENTILAALGADGPVRVLGAAREPEIRELCAFLRACGARIRGGGTGCLTLSPAPLHGTRWAVPPDRMEAATWLCAGAAAGGCLTLTGLRPEELEPVLRVLTEGGCQLRREKDRLTLTGPVRRAAGPVITGPYPAFPTDAQAPVMAALAKGTGVTVFHETVFENRYRHVPGLRAMGASIDLAGRVARVRGVPALRGAEVEATDLRGAAALVCAALGAEGTTHIRRAWHLDRGYGNLAARLRTLGAEVTTG